MIILDPNKPVPTSPLPPIAPSSDAPAVPADTPVVPSTDIPVTPTQGPTSVPSTTQVPPAPMAGIPGEEPKKEEIPGEGTPPAGQVPPSTI